MHIKNKIPTCPECESQNTLTNKDGQRRCRRCGYSWNKKEEKKK